MWKGQHGIFSDFNSINITFRPNSKEQRLTKKTLNITTCNERRLSI